MNIPPHQNIRVLCQNNGIDLLRLSKASGVSPLVIWSVFTGNQEQEVGVLLATIGQLVEEARGDVAQ